MQWDSELRLLIIIASEKNTEWRKYLEKTSDENLKTTRSPGGSTYAHIAAGLERSSKVLKEIILRCPKLVNVKDSINWTPLHWAAYYGNIENVKIIVELGWEIIDFNIIDSSGEIALDKARKKRWKKEKLNEIMSYLEGKMACQRLSIYKEELMQRVWHPTGPMFAHFLSDFKNDL